jgi:hypothetical protein
VESAAQSTPYHILSQRYVGGCGVTFNSLVHSLRYTGGVCYSVSSCFNFLRDIGRAEALLTLKGKEPALAHNMAVGFTAFISPS